MIEGRKRTMLVQLSVVRGMRFWALGTGLLLAAGAAEAYDSNCMTEVYIASFQGAGVEELTCAEVFRFTSPTRGGERTVRAIADLNADWAFQSGTVAAVEAAAREATAGQAVWATTGSAMSRPFCWPTSSPRRRPAAAMPARCWPRPGIRWTGWPESAG